MTGIDLREPFDGDTYNHKSDPLEALLRMRKWMFATGAVLILLHTGWLDFDALATSLKMNSLPKNIVHIAVTWTAVLQAIQVVILLVRVGLSYVGLIWTRSQEFMIPQRKNWDELIEIHEARARELELRADTAPVDDTRRTELRKEAMAARASADVLQGAVTRANETWSTALLWDIILEITRDIVRVVPWLAFFAFAIFSNAKFS